MLIQTHIRTRMHGNKVHLGLILITKYRATKRFNLILGSCSNGCKNTSKVLRQQGEGDHSFTTFISVYQDGDLYFIYSYLDFDENTRVLSGIMKKIT